MDIFDLVCLQIVKEDALSIIQSLRRNCWSSRIGRCCVLFFVLQGVELQRCSKATSMVDLSSPVELFPTVGKDQLELLGDISADPIS